MLDLSSRLRKPWEAKYEACMKQLNPKYSEKDREENKIRIVKEKLRAWTGRSLSRSPNLHNNLIEASEDPNASI